jgi:hypothetical protein
MDAEEQIENRGAGPMHARRIAMPDGRYLIFYTFGEPARLPVEPPSPEPRVTPESPEERRV